MLPRTPPHPDLEGGDGEEAQVERLGGGRLRLVEHGVDAHGEEHERHHHREPLYARVVGSLRPHKDRHPTAARHNAGQSSDIACMY